MITDHAVEILSEEGLQAFQLLRTEAVSSVAERLFSMPDSYYQQLGIEGWQLCKAGSYVRKNWLFILSF